MDSVPVPGVNDPYQAYDQGLYDQALRGFIDLQVEYPEDPAVALNVGSAHYQMRNYAEADRAFAAAVMATDTVLREQALYNLGNSAYRQGRLQEAVELYKAALEIDPEDEDAKFNLEFVRDEIRRRHEEAQKRQQQPQEGDSQERESQERESQEGESQQGEGQEQDQQQDQGQSETRPSEAESPTGAPEEAQSAGETPPDDASDEDSSASAGQRSGDEPQPQPGEQAAPAEAEDTGRLTPEEAERYLQALQEGRPLRAHPSRGQRARKDKDW